MTERQVNAELSRFKVSGFTVNDIDCSGSKLRIVDEFFGNEKQPERRGLCFDQKCLASCF